jgi:hypothetical protein
MSLGFWSLEWTWYLPPKSCLSPVVLNRGFFANQINVRMGRSIALDCQPFYGTLGNIEENTGVFIYS